MTPHLSPGNLLRHGGKRLANRIIVQRVQQPVQNEPDSKNAVGRQKQERAQKGDQDTEQMAELRAFHRARGPFADQEDGRQSAAEKEPAKLVDIDPSPS